MMILLTKLGSKITGKGLAASVALNAVSQLIGQNAAHSMVQLNKKHFSEEKGYKPNAGFLEERRAFYKKHPGSAALAGAIGLASTAYGAHSFSKLLK